jgi:hypothetical protein
MSQKERDAFVEGACWSDSDLAGTIDIATIKAEALRRYPDEEPSVIKDLGTIEFNDGMDDEEPRDDGFSRAAYLASRVVEEPRGDGLREALEYNTQEQDGYIYHGASSHAKIHSDKCVRCSALDILASPARTEGQALSDPRVQDLISAAHAVIESDDERDYQWLRQSLAALAAQQGET